MLSGRRQSSLWQYKGKPLNRTRPIRTVQGLNKRNKETLTVTFYILINEMSTIFRSNTLKSYLLHDLQLSPSINSLRHPSPTHLIVCASREFISENIPDSDLGLQNKEKGYRRNICSGAVTYTYVNRIEK